MTIEGLVLGHLPIFASAWATQYAKHVAQVSNKPVAFLRFTGDRASLDLYLPGTRHEPPVTRSTSLEQAVSVAIAHASRWIVRLPDACEPELVDAPIDVLTLLTGADEAAVVACYRTLKSLSSGSPDASRNENGESLGWRVAIMGADPIKADDAGNKVRRAAEAFLDASLEISPCIARIGAFKSSLLFEGTAALAWRDALDLIRSTPRHDPEPPPRPTHSPDTPPPRVEIRPIATEPARVESRPVPQPPRPVSRAVCGVIPGLRLSRVRCPTCPAIEFATDEQGRLHLIAHAGTADPVASLVAASGWASQHTALLTLADPAFRDVAEPVLHYVSIEPASDRRLLDTPIRIHAAVRVGDDTALVDLN